MKKLLIAIAVIIAIIVLLPFVVTMFVNPNDYKGEIVAAVEKQTGYKLDIQGDIGISMFPPSASVEDVFLFNPDTTTKEPLIKGLDATIKPDLMALLSGNVVIKGVGLNNAEINIVEYADGTQSWQNDQINGLVNPPKDTEGEQESVSGGADKKNKKSPFAGTVTINNTSFSLLTDKLKVKQGVKFKNAAIDFVSMQEPISYDADLIYNNMDLSLEGQYSNEQILGNASFKQTDLEYKVSSSNEGNFLKLDSKSINDIYEVAGLEPTSMGDIKLSIEGQPIKNDNKVVVKDFKIKLDNTNGQGNLAFDMDKMFADLDLKFSELNIDDITKILPPQKPASSNSASANAGSNAISGKAFSLPVAFEANVKSDTVVFQGNKHTNLVVGASGKTKDITIQPLSIKLNGKTLVEVFGLIIFRESGPKFEGSLVSSSPSLKSALKNFGIDIKTSSPNALGKFSINSSVIADSKLATISKIKAKLDETSISGDVRFFFSGNKKLDVDLALTEIDINSYMPPQANSAEASKERVLNRGLSRRYSQLDFLKKIPFAISPNIKVARAKIADEVLSDLRLVGTFDKELANVERFSFASRKLSAYGKAKIVFEKGDPSVEANISLGDINLDNFVAKGAKSSGQGSSSTSSASSGGAKWSTRPLSLAPLDVLKSDLKLTVSKVKQGDMVFDNISLNFASDRGILNVHNLSADFYDGKINTNASIDANGIPAFTTKGNLSGVNINKMLLASAKQQDAYGILSSSFNLSGVGASQKEIVSSLKGNLNVNASSMAVRGFDLQSFVRRLNSSGSIFDVGNLVSLASGKGVTKIKDLSGSVDIERGVAKIPNMKLDAEYAAGVAQGQVDLNTWTMDILSRFSLAIRGEKDYPTIDVGIKGDISNPKKYFDTAEVERYLSRKASDKALDYIQDKGVISNNRLKKVQELGVQGAIQDGLQKNIEKGIEKGAGKLLDKLF